MIHTVTRARGKAHRASRWARKAGQSSGCAAGEPGASATEWSARHPVADAPGSPGQTSSGRELLQFRLETLLHLLRADVLDVRGERPDVSERIDDAAAAVAVELVLDGLLHARPGRDGRGEPGVHVREVQAQPDR